MSDVLLSISLITYNQEDYISQTLDSLVNQQHNYPYEIVIGDDFSQDNTRKILLEYKEKYPDVIKLIFNEKNLGITKNYFNVLSHCSGKYIMECAGDDYWLPSKVEKQLSVMEADSEIILSYTNAIIKNEKSGLEKRWNPSKKIVFDNLIKGNCIPALSVCYKKSAFNDYIQEINPLEKNWLMEDFPMWLYFSRKGKIQYINEFLCVYRELEDSASHSYLNIDKRIRFTESTIDIQKYFSEKYNVNLDENFFNKLRSYVYLDFLLNLPEYDKNIANQFISLYRTSEKNKLKFFVKKIIVSNKLIFKIYKKYKQNK